MSKRARTLLPPETQSPWQVDPARGFDGAERLRT